MDKHNKTRSLYFPERIIKAMNIIVDYPLTVVEAPMGYGKTTAVREHLLGMPHANILWQKIYDNSTDIFWEGFCRLFGELDIDRSCNLAQLGFPNDSVSLHEALKLIGGIELPEKTVVVIDDYHLVNGAEMGRFIEFLVVNEIDHLHIVLTVRFIEFLNIEELSLKGFLSHITKETFELMPNEITRYYKICGISLKDNEADKLYSITEGWISALYLLMLNFKESGNLIASRNVYNLVQNAIYEPFSEDIKHFLMSMCIFDSFTMEQAIYMWGDENAEKLIAEITGKNAFVNYDVSTKTYQIHNIFTNFLQEILEKKDENYKKKIYNKAGHWYRKTGEYLAATHFFHMAVDFESLLETVEIDRTSSFGIERKELLIKYFEECPSEIKQNHLVSLLVYAMCLITYNEIGLFQKVCGEFVTLLQSSGLKSDRVNRLMGEFELLLSFTRYNDIMGMSQHHKKACELMMEPSAFMDTKGSWTFGSPSVLYMFYRESGKLETEVLEIQEAMPYYYRLTNGHGMGAEHVMAAEWHFNKGDFENAEIEVYKALYLAGDALQPNIVICALFLQVRLTLMKGEYTNALALLKKMHEEIERKRVYTLIHTIDMCTGFMNMCLQQSDKIPEWLVQGDFKSSRLFFPARAFANILYGKALLMRGEYLKLLGIAEQFIGIASVFESILAKTYTTIYVAAANERIYRRGEAIQALKRALDMAMPDKVYMPFVENCDYIKPLLDELYSQGSYHKDIARILELYAVYEKAVKQMTKEYFTEKKPMLTERETEIAQHAAEGLSNKGIAEKLFISKNTVKTQLKSVFEKLGINSRSLLKQYFEVKTKIR